MINHANLNPNVQYHEKCAINLRHCEGLMTHTDMDQTLTVPDAYWNQVRDCAQQELPHTFVINEKFMWPERLWISGHVITVENHRPPLSVPFPC